MLSCIDRPRFKWFIRIVAFIVSIGLICLAFLFPTDGRWRLGFLFCISGLFGFMLKAAPFGFTCSFRSLLSTGDVKDFTHMLHMIFWSTVFVLLLNKFSDKFHPLFFPNNTGPFGLAQSPIGVSLCLGSFLFGIGMQLGSGCATGTLVGMGEGFLKSWLVVWFFIMGATVAAIDPVYKIWSKLPKTSKPVVIEMYMIIPVGAVLLVCLVVMLIGKRRARIRREAAQAINLESVRALMIEGADGEKKPFLQRESWRFLADVILGLCVGLFFLCAGTTIGVMGVFPLIGSKFLTLCKLKGVENWQYWQDNAGQWKMGIRNNTLFYSDLFIIGGALLASAVLGNFGKSQKNSVADFFKAIFGGLLMGLGGRMSNGCNIGSMLSGINSGSVHGWVWMACAMLGSGVVVGFQKLIDKKCSKPDDYAIVSE